MSSRSRSSSRRRTSYKRVLKTGRWPSGSRLTSDARNKIRASQKRSSRNPCGKGRILRHGYTRRSSKGQSRVKASCVADRGASGYGAAVIPPLTRGFLGRYGYTARAQSRERRDALEDAIDDYGLPGVYRHLRDLVTLQRPNPDVHDKFFSDFKYLRKRYYPDRAKVYKIVDY